MSSAMQTLIYLMYGLEILGILFVIAAFISLVIRPMYRKYYGLRYRVKTVVVQGGGNHYYAEFKAGQEFDWLQQVYRYTCCNQS